MIKVEMIKLKQKQLLQVSGSKKMCIFLVSWCSAFVFEYTPYI